MPTLEFNGKHHIYTHHLTVPYRPLEADESRSCNPTGEGDNLIIHGDNLHALKALLPRYRNRIKCIYIDPPYNTGNEGWIYNDNVRSPLMQGWFKENSPIDNEDLEPSLNYTEESLPGCVLIRRWIATDAAGNEAISSQRITFVSPQPPTVSSPSNLAVACGSIEDASTTLSHNVITVHHPCNRPVTTTYTDSATINRCGFTFSRTWIVF